VSTQRYHTASWANADGSTTAVVLDSFADRSGWPSASAANPREAAEQLRDLLRWHAKRLRWMPTSDLQEIETIIFRVDVRPEHAIGERTISFPDTVALPVACVHAKRDEDVRVCFIPALEISFDYIAADELKPLVQQNVQRYVKDLTTRQLSRLLRPEELALDEITVRVDMP
jgi:hypothetical protein